MSSIPKGTKLKLKNTYQVGKQCGDGGFGFVYEEKDVKTGQKVAIKLFKSDAFTSPVEARMYWEREKDISKATTGYSKRHMEFIEAYETMANLATVAGVQGHQLTIHTPLIDMTKAGIIKRGLELGVDYAKTTSCYDPAPDGRSCGHCDSCLLRLKGFNDAGEIDPREYAGEPNA